MSRDSIRLNQLMLEVKTQLDTQFNHDVWVRGELSSYRQSGKHFYGELIDYEGDTKLASAKISVWERTAYAINTSFLEQTSQTLCMGMKVLLKVGVIFHPVYGLSLNVKDIEPSFTLGDREARKKKIRTTLQELGIFDNNKKLANPFDFFNIAVISSSTSAGLGDFESDSNRLVDLGLCSFENYYAKMQGEACNKEVTHAFRTIYTKLKQNPKYYDAIVLIRGGGSETDLDSFNYLEVCKAVCYMQVPVFVGIGHERDSVVLDEVAHRSFHTPSKVIKYILTHITTHALKVKKSYQSIEQKSRDVLNSAKEGLQRQQELTLLAKQVCHIQKNELLRMKEMFSLQNHNLIKHKKEKLKNFNHTILQEAKREFLGKKREILLLDNALKQESKRVIYRKKERLLFYQERIFSQSKNLIEKKKKEKSDVVNHLKFNLKNEIIFYQKNVNDLVKLSITQTKQSLKTVQKEQLTLKLLLLKQMQKHLITYKEKNRLLYRGVLAQSVSSTLERGFCLAESNNKLITTKKEALEKGVDSIIFSDGKLALKKE